MDSLQEARKILSKCLFMPLEKIPADADISAIEAMDSLTFETLILEIEVRTGREVDPVRLLELRSVQDIADLISGK